MRFLTNLLHKYFKEPRKVLGRWQLDECNKKINKKIDYSNEDHCGPCGQYKLPNEKKPTQKP